MRLLTITEAANRLGLKPATLRFWIWTRRIAYVKVGRSVRIREDTVDRIIEEGTIPSLDMGSKHSHLYRRTSGRVMTVNPEESRHAG